MYRKVQAGLGDSVHLFITQQLNPRPDISRKRFEKSSLRISSDFGCTLNKHRCFILRNSFLSSAGQVVSVPLDFSVLLAALEIGGYKERKTPSSEDTIFNFLLFW